MKTAIFIDGANLHNAARELGLNIDFAKLLTHFRGKCGDELMPAFYYTAIFDGDEYQSIRPLIDWLSYNGFVVRQKPAKEFFDQNGRRKVKANVDIELAVDAVQMAPHLDRLILFSGDGDFRALVDAVQRHGVHVTVVSTVKTNPSMIADELRRQTDVFIDLDDLRQQVAQAPKPQTVGVANG